jgi:hypothetical protein
LLRDFRFNPLRISGGGLFLRRRGGKAAVYDFSCAAAPGFPRPGAAA